MLPAWLAVNIAAGAVPHGLNVFEGKIYPHHPVMLQVPLLPYEMQPGLRTELGGLKVPWQFDCQNFWNGSQHLERLWEFNYYFISAARRLTCHEHQAFIEAGISHASPTLPLMDDEYSERVAVYQSVLRHRPGPHGPFRMAELGARWGTWGARAVALWRMVAGEAPYEVFFVESSKNACISLRQVMRINSIEYHLICEPATPEVFLKMMQGVDFIDLVHIDIQGHEAMLLADPAVADFLRRSAARIILGTHGEGVHEEIVESYKDWIPIMDYPVGEVWDCHRELCPTCGPMLTPRDVRRFRESKCFGLLPTTPQGAMLQHDGLLTLDNPRWVERTKTFGLNDTDLRIDDLKRPT